MTTRIHYESGDGCVTFECRDGAPYVSITTDQDADDDDIGIVRTLFLLDKPKAAKVSVMLAQFAGMGADVMRARIAELEALEKDAQRYCKWRAAYTNPNGRRHAIDTMLAAVASARTPEQVDAAIDGVCAALEQKP